MGDSTLGLTKRERRLFSPFFNNMDGKNKELLAIFLVCLAVFCVYLNTLPNSFIFDDQHMIVDNNYIKNLRHIPLFFKGKVTSYPIVEGMYRPLLMLSFVFNYFTSGLKPHGYHLINILIHFLNAVFLYLLLRLFLEELSFPLRLGITLIFCLHPVNTEAVTYISSRSDILCSFFILASLYAYIRSQNLQRKSLYILSLGMHILALLTKEVGLVVVGLVCAYEYIYTKYPFKAGRRIVLNILPFVLITIGYLFLRRYLFGAILASSIAPMLPRPLSSNILTQAAVSFYYLYLFFFPFWLCIDHNFLVITAFTDPLGLISSILIFVLVASCLFLRKRIVPIISFACLWYFICLSPKFYARLNLVCSEHQAYLAYFSLYFISGYLLATWKIKRIYLRQIFFFLLGLFFLLTLIRNFQWRNEYTLWRSTLKVNPQSGFAQGTLGLYLSDRGYFSEGLEYLKQAATSVTMEKVRTTSLLNLATHYALKGEPEKGLKILEKNQDYLRQVNSIGFFRSLSFVYFQMGKYEESRDILERIIRLYPQGASFKAILGWQYLQIFEDNQKAKQYFQAAIRDNPDLGIAHLGLGVVLENEDLKQAIQEYERTIKLVPQDHRAYYRLGIIYAQKLLNSQAEWYFKKTIQLSPDFAPAYNDLAVFYASMDPPHWRLAKEYSEKAKKLGYPVKEDFLNLIRENLFK